MASLRRILLTFSASLDLGLPQITGDVLLVGSAPGAKPPDGSLADVTLMTVNASQIVTESWGLAVPHFTILRPEIGSNTPVGQKAREVLSGRRTTTLIVANWRDGRASLEALLQDIGYKWETLMLLTEWQKQRVAFSTARSTTALEVGKLNISSGAFGAALAIFQGARRVAITGFSFTTDGHAYDTSVTPRLHVEGDRIVLNALSRRSGKIFAVEPNFSQECGLPLCSNSFEDR